MEIVETKNDALLEAKSINKRFLGQLALDKVSIKIKPGEVHALMGENGAGKSTLIKIIAGIYQLDAGEILVNGIPVKISSPADSRKLGMAFIHQEVNIIPHLTVAENILLGKYKRNKFGMISSKEMINEAQNIPNALPMNVGMKEIAGKD